MTVYNAIPIWLLMLVMALLILAASEIGFRIGTASPAADRIEGPSAIVETTVFTLLALLLGFSYSLALGRYDARRTIFGEETIAIRTAYLRTNLLPPATARDMRGLMRAYVAERLDFVRTEDAAPEQARAADDSAKLQRQMWALATAASLRDPRSTLTPQFVGSLNAMIEVGAREAGLLAAHIPDIVMFLLMLLTLLTAGMLGTLFARVRQRAIGPRIVYAIVLVVAIGLVLDLDRPQRGLIRVNLDPMLTLQRDMVTGAPVQSL